MITNIIVTWVVGIALIGCLCGWLGFKGYQYLKHLQINRAFKQAMAKNEFEIYYQPIIDLKNGRVGGIEALLRWIHPTQGVISPMEFIPLAEKSGMILEIGEWVIERSAMLTL